LISEIDSAPVEKVTTGPWDTVFGGGLARTGVYLLGGAPGAGKTTLLIQIASAFPGETLYITTEQSKEDLRDTWVRLKLIKPFRVAPFLEVEDSLDGILEEYKPSLLVLDSLQGLCGDDPSGHNVACSLIKRHAVRNHCPAIVVSHITKDQMLAGRMTVQHMVDTTCMLYLSEEERILTTLKNRYGPAFVEVAFSMGPRGLELQR